MSSSTQTVTGLGDSKSQESTKYRWVAEFLAGPSGYMEKEEIVSEWFPDLNGAKMNAIDKAEREVQDFPYSRGRILKLFVEDNAGKEVKELCNAKTNVPVR